MYPRDIKYGVEAMETIVRATGKLVRVVGATLGPAGKTVFIDEGNGMTRITKDGVSVARHVFVEDATENMVIQTIKEVAWQLGHYDVNASRNASDAADTFWGRNIAPFLPSFLSAGAVLVVFGLS